MKSVFALVLVAVAYVSAESSVDYHLNSMIEQMPPSVEMLQIQASMLSSTTIDVRDEIAALLYKMQKDNRHASKEAATNNRRTQGYCSKNLRRYRRNIRRAKFGQKKWAANQKAHHDKQRIIPDQVLHMEAKIRGIKSDIAEAEIGLSKKQEQRNADSDTYLKAISDFNKALNDIDLLRTLVENGLSNRGQGASEGDTRHTQSPTVKGYVAPPTAIAYDRKDTHAATQPGKFVEMRSNEELASMSREETVITMKGIYSQLKSAPDSNPMVLAVVGTLDSVMAELEQGNAVDKIRSLLIQVRNELQKSKREMTAAENTAINTWKTRKLALRTEVNDLKITWQNIYKAKAQKWQQYGDEFQAEGKAMRMFAFNKRNEDSNTINRDFDTVVCETQQADYVRGENKRHGQLLQIQKALKLLEKFGLSGEAGKQVREGIKDITAGLCRAFDDESGFVTIASEDFQFGSKAGAKSPVISSNKAALAKYPNNKNAKGKPFVCISQMRFTVTCKGQCDVRASDRRLPVQGTYDESNTKPRVFASSSPRDYNRARTRTLRLKKPMVFENFNMFSMMKHGGVTRGDVDVFVVPGCNCRSNPDVGYDVKGNVANTAKADKAGLLEAL